MFSIGVLESFLVYSGLLITLPMLGHAANQVYVRKSYSEYSYWFFLLCIIVLFSLVFGARYNVGVDYLSYKESYEIINSGRQGRDTYELGYLIINRFAGLFHHYFFLFFFFCLIQIGLIVFAFKRQPAILPWILMVLLSSQFMVMMTLVRQMTFVCLFIWIISRIDKLNFLKYSLLIIFGTLAFHKSALVLLPFYPIVKTTKNLCWCDGFQIIVYLICLFIGYSEFIIDKFEDFSTVANLLGYSQYSHFNVLKALYQDPNWGPRTIIRFAPPLLAMFMHKKVANYFNNDTYKRYYNLFFWGMCWQAIFYGTNVILRVFLPLYFLKTIIEGYTLYYLYINKNKSFLAYFIFFLMCALLLLDLLSILYEASLPDNTCAFTFFWQQ